MLARTIRSLVPVCLILLGACDGGWAAAPRAGRSSREVDPRQPRTWTDISGTHKIRATLVEFADEKARLRKTDGTEVVVPIGALSKTDQEWLRRHATAAPAAPAAGGEWPGWLGPNRDNKSPDTGLLKEWPEGGPKLLWKMDGIGTGFSSAIVAGGLVYITGNIDGTEALFALDPDGKQQWKVENGQEWTENYPGSRGSPTVDGGNLYLLSGTGRIACFDAKTGQERWAREAKEFGGRPGGWGYAESVLILDRLAVFKPGGKDCIVALDKQSGEPVWKSTGFEAGPEYSSCLAIEQDGAPMITTGTRGGIVGVNARNGELLWQNKFAADNVANCPTPAYSDGYVFWANGYGKGGICLKLEPGGKATEAWTTRDMECHHGGYVIDQGHIYGNNGGGWACLDLKTGQKKWGERAVGKGSLCWADGMLYLFGESGGKAALATCSPEGLEIKGQVTVQGDGPSWAHPVVVGGRLYLRYDTHLYCFDVKGG